MYSIEPFYHWLHIYNASEDDASPFYERVYSEFEFTNTLYNFNIHPQWDEFGSATLYLKLLQVDYDRKYAILELLGEWNDCLYNDIKFLKENVIDILTSNDINKFILIGENVLNFHYSDDSYYQEWFDEIPEGWIACVNFRKHVIEEFAKANIDYYMAFGNNLNDLNWRKSSPLLLYETIDSIITKRLKP